jgi:Protein of unknown function, DUF547
VADTGALVKEGMATMWRVALGGILLLAGCSTVPTSFTPVNQIPTEQFSHQVFEDMLGVEVKDGVVDYPAIQADRRLSIYLAQLDRVDPNRFATRNEQLAFWINAYNAFAIKGIIDRLSPMSWIGRYRYFIGREYQVGGQTVNLYDLERSILIARFHEPRMHFAIVCASLSCPKLQSWTYQGDQLDRQLDHVARVFINDPARNRFDRVNKVAALSMIFRWFEQDFTEAAGSLSAFLARYIEDPELAEELGRQGYRIEYLEYDWSLNGKEPKESIHVGAS